MMVGEGHFERAAAIRKSTSAREPRTFLSLVIIVPTFHEHIPMQKTIMSYDSSKALSAEHNAKSGFYVQDIESGQKILQLLERRLHLAQSLLHRWIRTGQIRRNGARCKPFEHIVHGDFIRIPPFAWHMAAQATFQKRALRPQSALLPLPRIIGEHDGLLVFSKPSGLPTHAGTGHTDSLADRLQARFADTVFVPVPCHRLDKETSGLILVAKSFSALRYAQKAILDGSLRKDYLCWVAGSWPWKETLCLYDCMKRSQLGDTERMCIVSHTTRGGKEGRCEVRPLVIEAEKSLLLVTLLTGRTHQIRLQMAASGHSVLGDTRYGSQHDGCTTLYLHSCRLTLPDGHSFTDLPSWQAPYAVPSFPFL